MSRAFTRILVVTLVALALGLTAVAPANAGPAPVRRPVQGTTTTSWIGNAWAVLQGFLTGAPARPVSLAKSDTLVYTPKYPGGGAVVPLNGSCIDPMGRPAPCHQ